MITTTLKWHKPSKKKPRVDKHAYYSSVKVLIKWIWVNNPTPIPLVSIGRYMSKYNQWILDGASGKIKILRWAYITCPGYSDPITPKPKIKKSKTIHL